MHLRKLWVALVLVAGFSVISTAAASAKVTMRKIPANFVYLGHVTDGRCLWGVGIEYPSVEHASSYSISYYDGYWRAWEAGSATVPVPKTQGMTKGLNYFGITGGGGPAPCGTDATQGGRFTKPIKAYAIFNGKEPKTGAIEGEVTNEDGNPVEGAKITAYGPTHKTTESGPGGLYYMEVDDGHYRVVPDDPSVKKSSFKPTDERVTVKKADEATANFKLDGGLQLTMDLSSTTVSASGYKIVTGTITTTKYGKPAPDINIRLSVDPTDPGAVLTTAPKVAVCGTTGRIWPTGSISDLDGNDVTITTDSDGKYQFSLTVGTIPGKWELDAWAMNNDGKLSTDVSRASDTRDLNITAVTPTTSIDNFVTAIDAMKSTSSASQLSSNPGALSQLLSTLGAVSGNGFQFTGMTFSVGQGTDGQNLVIAPSTSRFVIGSDGQIKRSSSVLDDLIIDPQEWTGTGISGVTPGTSLQSVLQQGQLTDVPTVNDWQDGASGNPGWSLTSNTLSDPNSSLEYFGWAYPPVNSTPGYCN
jgi:Carboxypeptidase regulatory-like domain